MCGCAGSINSRLASGDKASFFFQPVQRHFELPDLLVSLGLQGVLILLSLGTSRRENLRDLLLQLMFPVRDLGGMHPIGTRSLVDRFMPFASVQCDPSFELRAVPFPLCRHLPTPHLLLSY